MEKYKDWKFKWKKLYQSQTRQAKSQRIRKYPKVTNAALKDAKYKDC